MICIPDKIAYFTDEVAKSRIKIFQLWRKLLASTFGTIKRITLYIGHISFFHISPNNLTSFGVEMNALIRHCFSKVSATVNKNGYKH